MKINNNYYQINNPYKKQYTKATVNVNIQPAFKSIDFLTRNLYINTNNQMLSQDIPKGYRGTSPVNTENPELSTQRIYCWCRMTHPAMSRWVFNRETAYCANSCTDYCANYVNTSNGIDMYQRINIFRSIGQ